MGDDSNNNKQITIGNIIGSNARTVLVIVSFIGALYVQNEINKVNIMELRKSVDLKLDRAVFNATMQQMQLIQADMRETRGDVKHILQIVGDKKK